MKEDRYNELLGIIKKKKVPIHVQRQIGLMYNASDNKSAFLQDILSAIEQGRIPQNIGFPREMTLLSNSECYSEIPAKDKSTVQRITITENGQVSLTQYNCDMQMLCEEEFTVSILQGVSVLKKIGDLFSVYMNKPQCTGIGSWNLTITNQGNEQFSFAGNLLCENKGWLTSISKLIRTTLGRRDLFLFDGGSNDGTAYYSCEFEFGGKRYYYTADELPLTIGDRVVVPCGNNDQPSEATVVDVEFWNKNPLPFPIKAILKKAEPEISDSEVTIYTIVKSVIDAIDCEDLLAMGCPADEYDGESKMIAEKIHASVTVYQIATIIAEIMSHSFNEPYEANSFIIAGAQILDLMKKNL